MIDDTTTQDMFDLLDRAEGKSLPASAASPATESNSGVDQCCRKTTVDLVDQCCRDGRPACLGDLGSCPRYRGTGFRFIRRA